MKKAKMTMEEFLREQGLHQVDINELLYPKEQKKETEDEHEKRTAGAITRKKGKN